MFGRGRGGRFRGFRRGGGNARGKFQGMQQNEGESSRGSHGRPPGLTGKQIGLYYAGKAKQQREESYPVISMKASTENLVRDLLRNFSQSGDRASLSGFHKFKSSSIGDLISEELLDGIEDSNFKNKYMENLKKNLNADQNSREYLPPKLIQNQQIDLSLQEEFEDMQDKKLYKKMLDCRKRLPSYDMRNEIVDKVKNSEAVVLSGETGCGKTTQVPQFILDDAIMAGRGSVTRIICTQPRRISAISIAKRVAEERGEKLGTSVGYQIRLESVRPRETGSITYCTTGIVLKWLESDPMLLGISHLVIDEVHERDTLSDFLMCIAKDLLVKRSDLKVILMSATLNAELFSHYYGKCPMLHIPGFTFPVTEYYLEDVIEALRYSFPEDDTQRYGRRNKVPRDFQDQVIPAIRELSRGRTYSTATIGQLLNPKSEELDMDLIFELILHINKKPPGAILVFVPGWADISTLHEKLQKQNNESMAVYPLHSLMPTINQREVFDPPPPGVRKVILATNIAETSITINDIVYVIDCGKIKMKCYNKELNVTTLLPEWVAIANARQRKGRAGRVQAGICYHLFTKARRDILEDFSLPEMQRTRLEEVLLMVKSLHLGKCRHFLSRVIDAPDEEVLEDSLKLLRSISAFDDDENLTPLGYHLAKLPMDPLIGKMLIMGAIFSCLDPVLTITASLSFKDPFYTPLGKEQLVDECKFDFDEGLKSDHILLVNVYKQWLSQDSVGQGSHFAWRNFLSTSVLHQIKGLRQQFMNILYDHKFVSTKNINSQEVNRNSANITILRAVIAAGLYPNVGRILVNAQNIMKSIRGGDKKVELHPKSVNSKYRTFEGLWLMYWLRMKTSKIYLYDSTMVSNFPLAFFGAHLHYDIEKQLLVVDKMVKFKCKKTVYHIIKDLRIELNHILEYKIAHPGTQVWDRDSFGSKVLSQLIQILIEEEEDHQYG